MFDCLLSSVILKIFHHNCLFFSSFYFIEAVKDLPTTGVLAQDGYTGIVFYYYLDIITTGRKADVIHLSLTCRPIALLGLLTSVILNSQ